MLKAGECLSAMKSRLVDSLRIVVLISEIPATRCHQIDVYPAGIRCLDSEESAHLIISDDQMIDGGTNVIVLEPVVEKNQGNCPEFPSPVQL